jgi:hypothetical protein
MGDSNPRPRGREEDELPLSYKLSCTGERTSGAAVRAMCAAPRNAPGRSAETARQARKAWARIVAREDPLRILVPKLVGLVTRFSWASGHIFL